MFIRVLSLPFLEILKTMSVREGVSRIVGGLYLKENVPSLSLSLWEKTFRSVYIIGKILSPEQLQHTHFSP